MKHEKNIINYGLINTIKEDCRLYEKLNNGFIYLELVECDNSMETGLFQLTKNGIELWYGTLQEINAVVKVLIKELTAQ